MKFNATIARDRREYACLVVEATSQAEAERIIHEALTTENGIWQGHSLFRDLTWDVANEPGDVELINSIEADKSLTEDQFEERYTSVNAPDGSMIWEHEDCKGFPANRVWTLIDGEDGKRWLLTGFHVVNKVGYVVTEQPWTDEEIQVQLDEDEET